MSKVVQISSKSDNCMSVSPLTALKEMIEDIESGELDIKQLVVNFVKADDVWGYRCAQVTVSDTCYILAIAQSALMDRTKHYED